MVKNPLANAGDMRLGFDPWIGKIPWREAWQPTPVFLPGESHGQRSLAGYSPWGRTESDTTEVTACKDTGVAQLVKNPPAMRKTWVQSLGWEDPLEEGMATHSSVLAWRIPMDRGAWQAAVCGVGKNWTRLSDSAQHSTSSGEAVDPKFSDSLSSSSSMPGRLS